eukprot:3243619-Amphidinium_carterae.1
MTHELKTLTNRDCGWYSRKDVDRQFQIKGENVGREATWTIIVEVHGDEGSVQAKTQKTH